MRLEFYKPIKEIAMSYAKAVSEGRSNHCVSKGYTEYDSDGNEISKSTMQEITFSGKDEKALVIYMNKWLSMPETKEWLAQYKCQLCLYLQKGDNR